LIGFATEYKNFGKLLRGEGRDLEINLINYFTTILWKLLSIYKIRKILL
jgi:hypothetical protein